MTESQRSCTWCAQPIGTDEPRVKVAPGTPLETIYHTDPCYGLHEHQRAEDAEAEVAALLGKLNRALVALERVLEADSPTDLEPGGRDWFPAREAAWALITELEGST